jgi:hypothetical protein
MSDVSADSGLVVPLFFISRMLTGEYAVRFDASMEGWLDFYSDVQRSDDDEFAKRTRNSRADVDYLVDGFFGAYHSIRYVEGFETSVAFSKLIEQTEGFDCHGIFMMDSIFTDTFGKNKIPSFRSVIFFEYSVHGDPWGIEGIRNGFQSVSAVMSYDEYMEEIRNKPCFVFDEKECFRTSLSAKGKRFKELLGITTLETSYWPVNSF